MINLMNQYISNINLKADDMSKQIFITAVKNQDNVQDISVIIRNNKYIVDIKLVTFSEDKVIQMMNCFMESTRYAYSSFYLRFNEGNQIRYRYASLKENKDGFYCDVVFS